MLHSAAVSLGEATGACNREKNSSNNYFDHKASTLNEHSTRLFQKVSATACILLSTSNLKLKLLSALSVAPLTWRKRVPSTRATHRTVSTKIQLHAWRGHRVLIYNAIM